jgi:catechol 2,3-dioxygenase-like lactoylglutathione lyase family enzyme
MKVQFVAGFAPIVRDLEASQAFYRDTLGLPLGEGDYPATDKLEGVKHFGLWPLTEAARLCFGTSTWPEELPIPQGCLEFDVESEEAVAAAGTELEDRGYRLLVKPKREEWGQTVVRLLSPEGLLVGITYTPWHHEPR